MLNGCQGRSEGHCEAVGDEGKRGWGAFDSLSECQRVAPDHLAGRSPGLRRTPNGSRSIDGHMASEPADFWASSPLCHILKRTFENVTDVQIPRPGGGDPGVPRLSAGRWDMDGSTAQSRPQFWELFYGGTCGA